MLLTGQRSTPQCLDTPVSCLKLFVFELISFGSKNSTLGVVRWEKFLSVLMLKAFKSVEWGEPIYLVWVVIR